MKAKILQVGTIDQTIDQDGTLKHWRFDCMGTEPLLELDDDGFVLLIAGYTMDELHLIEAIHRRYGWWP